MAATSSYNRSIKLLNKSNYDTWCLQAQAVLIKNYSWEIVSGEKILSPKADSAATAAFNKEDLKAKAEILLLLPPSELKQIETCATSKAVWDKLKATYQSSGPARKATLLKQLVLKQMSAEEDIHDHINTFMDVVDKLADMDIKIPAELLSIMLLCSLPTAFENFRIAIESRDTLPSPEDLKVKFFEEYQARSHSEQPENSEAYVFKKNKQKPYCKSCKKKGHTIEKCWGNKKKNAYQKENRNESASGSGSEQEKPKFDTSNISEKISSGMAGIMSKLKSNPSAEINPIEQFFEVGKESSNVGTCLIWRVYDAYRRSDGKECSVFVFDKRIAEKLYKPKRKESMLDRIKYSVTALERLRSPRMLQIVHSIEEASHTVAFASEPIIGCLHNILSFHESSVAPGAPPPVMPHPITLGPPGIQAQQMQIPAIRPKFAKEYYFLDIEIRYGILQIIEALQYMHYSAHLIHRNVCPQTIIVTKKGTWKLFGLEYVEPVRARALPTPPPRSNLPVQFTSMIPPPMKPSPLAEKPVVPGAKRLDGPPDEATLAKNDSIEMVAVPPWSIKVARLVQPNLDFMAPECQTNGQVCVLSDMFSLGLVICAIFNNGKSLIQANNNPLLYLKQIEYLDHQVGLLMERIPTALQEAVQRLLIKDPHPRPTSQLLPLIKYFKGPCEQTIATMQFLDIVLVKEPGTKGQFYRGQLMDALPYIPKKLRWQHVWPVVQLELRTVEMLSSALLPAIWLCNDASHEEFTTLMLPTVKSVMHTPKNIQSTVTILENLHIFLKKCTKADVTNEMMQMLYTALDNTASPVQFELQTSSLIALQNISELMDDRILHNIILPKVRLLLETNQSDVKVICLILGFFEKVLLRLERGHILEQVIPTLLKMRLSDPDIINRVVKLYKSMLMEKKFGLTSNVMATKMIPALAPQTINPALNVDQFTNLMEILYDMLDNIDQTQRAKLKLDHLGLGSPERHRLRYQMSSDNMNAPPFNIPNLRVEKRKTSSAEDMARKNSISGPPPTGSVGGFKSTGLGQWFFGSSNSTNNDGNFLRVVSAFPGRRLSDNTLMTPKIRVAPSCASSPGGTPGGTSGLPTRRHSSIGPQERRCSNVNLSPPTGYQYKGRTAGSGSSLSVPAGSQCAGGSMPNTSSSVPFLLTSSMQSIRSRRPSACSQGSGILQQLSSGVYQLFSGRT